MTRPRVLLVENDPELTAMLVELLTAEGYAVDAAPDGQRGLHLGLTRDYDVLLLDRGLPALDGLDLLTRLRGQGRITPTLVLSGELDIILPPRFGRSVAASIPKARFEVMPGEAHQPFQEVPDEFNTRVEAFWREVEARG